MLPIARLGIILACCTSVPASALDIAAMQKWGNVKVVRYLVKGEHNVRTSVVHGDHYGNADVLDRVTVEFTWDLRKGQLVGPVTVKDDKTELKNLKADDTNCAPPTLNGEYEHFQSVSNSVDGETLEIKGVRTYPAAMVPNYPASCSMKAIPGVKEDVSVYVPVPNPGLLGLPPEMTKSGPISVASDGKSFSTKGASNWVWTFVPTIVQ